MSKPTFVAAAAATALMLSSCFPPPIIQSPRSPNSPENEEPYDQNVDPNGQGIVEPPSEPARPGEYPTARKTANPNEVISPYEPYNVIDVQGFSSGQLVRDPSNKKIFRVP